MEEESKFGIFFWKKKKEKKAASAWWPVFSDTTDPPLDASEG